MRLIHLLRIVLLGLASVFAQPAAASPLVYTPINSNFGGNPFANAPLQYSAEVNRPQRPTDPNASISNQTLAETVRNAFLSRLSSDIYNQIFGDNALNSGSFNLGDGNIINFQRDGNEVIINFIDPIRGLTTIRVPAF